VPVGKSKIEWISLRRLVRPLFFLLRTCRIPPAINDESIFLEPHQPEDEVIGCRQEAYCCTWPGKRIGPATNRIFPVPDGERLGTKLAERKVGYDYDHDNTETASADWRKPTGTRWTKPAHADCGAAHCGCQRADDRDPDLIVKELLGSS
jgi:hypothetical protein